MSVSNGQSATATIFNNAFVSKTVDSTMVGVLDLNNGGSGAQVPNVQQAINDDVAALAAHLSDASDAHDATAISNIPAGNLAATNVQAALDELQADVDTRTTTAQATAAADAQIDVRRGAVNGIASLNGAGLVPASELPSFVDDVLEFANLAAFPVTGETGKIYIAIDTGKTYRWSGSIYVEISSGAVGSVNGQTGIVVLDQTDIGLDQVDNTSDATKNAAAVVLTNKDYDGGTASNTRRMTVPKDTKANLDALTRKEATIVYATDLDKLYADDGSTLVEIGSGSGGGTFIAPTAQVFLSGSGTYNRNYAFTITSGSATIGATYTNNGVTFTVYATVASATLVYMSGNNVPLASGTLTKTSGTGDATLTFSAFRAPLSLIVDVLASGGGGSGSGVGAGSGTAGNNSTFGSSFITAGGGTQGVAAGNGGAGGTNTFNPGSTGAVALINVTGNGGRGANGSGVVPAGTTANQGGSGPFGGQAQMNYFANAIAPDANSGCGGNGAGTGVGTIQDGVGGGSGGYLKVLIPNPDVTYAYSVAASSAGGSAGSGYAGAASGSGKIMVLENYQ